MAKYRKYIVSLILSLLLIADYYLGPDNIVSLVVLTFLGSSGVLAVRNAQPAKHSGRHPERNKLYGH